MVCHIFYGCEEFLAPLLVYGEVICKEVIFPVNFDTQNSLANKKGINFLPKKDRRLILAACVPCTYRDTVAWPGGQQLRVFFFLMQNSWIIQGVRERA